MDETGVPIVEPRTDGWAEGQKRHEPNKKNPLERRRQEPTPPGPGSKERKKGL